MDWHVCELCARGGQKAPATKTMVVKHLASECSGIGYDMWADYETVNHK